MRWPAVFFLLPCLGAAPPLARQIDRALESSPAARRAFWGVRVADPASGKTLYARNDDHFFVPASNTKLFSTALALTRLGPEHVFQTIVRAASPPDAAGVLRGDLALIGGGDPNLSGRTIPYRKGAATGNPLEAVEALAGQVAARGVRRIEGDVVGDDTAYVWEPYPDGWSLNDAIWEYGAPVSALILHDNAFTLTVRPGEPARLSLLPPLEHYIIENRVRTDTGMTRHIHIDRLAGSRELKVWGTMAPNDSGYSQLLAIEDPALYAARAFYDALNKRGVSIAGQPVARHRFASSVADLKSGAPARAPGGVELARRTSAPLIESLRIINKVSQNLHAEIVLREVGRVRRGIGSREAGIEELKTFLAEAGLKPDSYHFEDGSGLSRLTLITPAGVAALLQHMHRSPYREQWVSLLPIGGEDGTLAGRFEGAAAARGIHAKTGTLSHVSALSGYAVSSGRAPLVFSILVNNYNAPSSEIRAVIDRIGLAIIRR